ncbi:MAG: 3H domain-containing protein [Sarcina sp.]
MTADDRRESIKQILFTADKAINGTELAKDLGVTRQIIVQDIALLRANGISIFSTNKGYILKNNFENKSSKFEKIFEVIHDVNAIETELNTIVDNGGKIISTMIRHPIYGEISVSMSISCRRDVKNFLEKINNSEFIPLTTLTKERHFHKIQCDSLESLNLIELELKNLGYLKL